MGKHLQTIIEWVIVVPLEPARVQEEHDIRELFVIVDDVAARLSFRNA